MPKHRARKDKNFRRSLSFVVWSIAYFVIEFKTERKGFNDLLNVLKSPCNIIYIKEVKSNDLQNR